MSQYLIPGDLTSEISYIFLWISLWALSSLIIDEYLAVNNFKLKIILYLIILFVAVMLYFYK